MPAETISSSPHKDLFRKEREKVVFSTDARINPEDSREWE